MRFHVAIVGAALLVQNVRSATLATCKRDACLLAVEANREAPWDRWKPGCTSFFMKTVTPKPVAKTVTAHQTRTASVFVTDSTTVDDAVMPTVTVFSTVVSSEAETTTVTDIATDTTTVISTDFETTTFIATDSETTTVVVVEDSTVTLTVVPTPSSILPPRLRRDLRRGLMTSQPSCPTTPACPSKVPAYASACCDTVAYSSACSCVGVARSTTTLTPCTTTVTTTNTQIITRTGTREATVTVTATQPTTVVDTTTVETTLLGTATFATTVQATETDYTTVEATETDEVTMLVATATATTTDVTTVVVTPSAAPPGCDNDGLQWALYPNSQGPDNFAYYQFDPTLYKSVTPEDVGSQGYIGLLFQDASDPEPQGSIYGLPSMQVQYIVLNHRGYLFASQPGVYTFTLNLPDDAACIWVGNYAYSGWTTTNANACRYGNPYGGAPFTIALPLPKGSYTPFRVAYVNAQDNAYLSLSIEAPDGTLLLGANTALSDAIVQFGCDSSDGAPSFQDFGSET